MVVKLVNLETSAEYAASNIGETLIIGREKRCSIVLPADASGVSRIHATIKWISQDSVELTDSSTYGTSVRGIEVIGRSVSLFHGDTVIVGETSFRVEILSDRTLPQRSLESATEYRSQISIENGNGMSQINKRPTSSTASSKLGSQRKVSEFFSKPIKKDEVEVIAEDTPSFLLQKPASQAGRRGSIVPDSQSQKSLSSALSTSRRPIVLDDDDDIFVVPAKKLARSKKSALLAAPPKQTRPSKASSVLAQDTVPADLVGARRSSIGGTCVDDSLLQQKSASNTPKSIVDSEKLLDDDDDFDVPMPARPSSRMDLDDVHSQMRVSPLANSTQLPISQCGRVKKRSAFAAPAVPLKTEEDLVGKAVPSYMEEPPAKRRGCTPVSSLIAENMMEIDSVSVTSQLPNGPSTSHSIWGSVGGSEPTPVPPQPKRRGRPPKDASKLTHSVVSNYSSLDENSRLDRTVAAVDLSMVSSGTKKYEDLVDEESQGEPIGRGKGVNEDMIEKVVKKMSHLITFAELVRPTPAPNMSRSSSWGDKTTSTEGGGANFKRFRKANQGRFNNSISTARCVLGGSEDLVDFRKVRI